MKDRKYVVGRNGLTVWTPFSTANVGWKPLTVLAAVFVLLSAVFVFAAVLAIKALVFVAILGFVIYIWLRIRRFGRDLPPGAGATTMRPTPSPTRVGGGEQEFPEE